MTHQDIIDDVYKHIIAEWSEAQQNEFFLTPYRSNGALSTYHHTLGQWIRNTYSLWSIPWEPQIEQYMGGMCDCSPYHPDAVSSTIMKEVWKKGMRGGNEVLE